ncbi:uncharacterized protein [Nicotiana tomentosiformis]|uniref:uncharacterized protein n=1 Tax=Nicotiana tomentosiformis TaxID=4098 RepID=UPI00388C84D0
MEDLMKTFIIKTNERLDVHDESIKELGTYFRSVEKQVGHLAILMSERALGTLPVDTERNPKDIVNVVTLRSEKELKDITPIQKDMRHKKESGEQLKNGVEKKKEGKSRREKHEASKHMPALPFPQKLSREIMDKQFERFIDVLKQVHVNLPFIEVLSQMPTYAKFLKEILTKKRKIKDTLVVKLTDNYSAILQNKLPQKCGDPRSFTIPFSLGTTNFDKSLCDSDASINLMPLSIYRKLEKEIGKIRSTPIYLQLANQTTLIPERIVEYVLVQVDKFVFPVDFIVVKMEESKEVPLILGRSFLATGRAILDIHEIKLMLRVGEETVTFDMNVETGVKREKLTASVVLKVKGVKEKVAVSEKDKCGVYPKKDENNLSAWMCTLVRARGVEPNSNSNPD